MIDIQRVDSAIESRLDENLQELSELCSKPSISAQGIAMEETAQLVSALFAQRGFKTSVMPSKGFPVVFAERKGQSERTLLFYNHYDVQPAEPLDQWDSPPFEPIIRDGKMYARGVSDDKGHILCRLAAIDALLEINGELPCSVLFVVEGEEEIGSINLPQFLEMNRQRLAADACIWEFGSVNHEGTPIQIAGMRGSCYVELNVRTASRDAHSGLGGSIFPNAAWRLIWALGTLKDGDEHIRLPGFYDKVVAPTEEDLAHLAQLPDEAEHLRQTYGLHGFLKDLQGGIALKVEEVFKPTCTICGVTTGYQGPGIKTVLPAQASAKIDFRLVPDQHPDDVLQQLRRHLDDKGYGDIEITYLGGEPAGRTDLNDPFLQMVVESARDVYGVPQLIRPMIGSSGPYHMFQEILQVPIATAGVCYPDSRPHAPNENLVIENFVNGARHTARILANFGQFK